MATALLFSISGVAQSPSAPAKTSPGTLSLLRIPPFLNATYPAITYPNTTYPATTYPRPHVPVNDESAAVSAANPAATKPGAVDSRLSVQTDIRVQADDPAVDTSESNARSFTTQQLETSAGTFGDPLRFVQVLAGVISDNDQRNDFIVRGGNPAENGFVIDNIEVPSINQLALSDTTGGLTSMLDAAAIRRMTLHTDVYESRFDERLSSIFEISTRPEGAVTPHRELEFGIAGVGGSIARQIAGVNIFASERHGVMQYVTSDIGMNGVPHYDNAFLRADGHSGNDSWWGMSLSGIDSIQIRPAFLDSEETNPYDIDYSGWRNTTGVNWQHIFSARSFGVASVAQAEQSQSVTQNAQLEQGALVYSEHSRDAFTTVKYDWTMLPNHWLTLHAGGRSSVDALHYAIAQPVGLQNPYSTSTDAVNLMATDDRFATVSSAAYIEASAKLGGGFELAGGLRAMHWALGGHERTTGRATLSKSLGGRLLQVGYAEYAEMPPTLYLLSFNNLRTLQPIVSRQVTASATLVDNPRARMSVDIYSKRYSDYPVAQQYPQLTMANIADTFGQAFLMFPMVGSGTGVARGVEWTGQLHATTKIELTGTVAYARSWYAGLDGVLRRSNYDLPVVANLTGTWMLPHRLTLAWRFSATSGRPYTPDDLTASIAQNRDVYDLSQINGIRSNAYQRLDVSVSQEHKLVSGVLRWRVGVLNAMNRQNFYCELWEPRMSQLSGQPTRDSQSIQYQMPLFPEAEVRYIF